MISLSSPFARHLGRPVRRFSALDAFRLQQALPDVDLVPPRGPGRPRKEQTQTGPVGVKRSVTPTGLGLGCVSALTVSASVLVGGASNTSQTAQK